MTMEVILNRRSIRKYKDRDIAPETVEKLLRAAMSAPSAGNEQPWHFIVVDEREKLDQIPEIHPYSDMVTQAPVAVLVCGDKGEQKHEGFWVQDCSAATENILIAAEAENLGAVWLGIYPDKERVQSFKEFFNLPEPIVPFSLIPVGYPAEEKPPSDRYKKSRVHKNLW